METEPPGFMINLPFTGMSEKPADFPEAILPENPRCAPISTNFTSDGDDFRRCDGMIPLPSDQEESPPSRKPTPEPEVREESSFPVQENDTVEKEVDSKNQFPGKVIVNPDGVVCFLLSPNANCDVPDIWPICPNPLTFDSRSSSPVPSSLFPFHFFAVIPSDDISSTQLFQTSLPGSAECDLPEQYHRLCDLHSTASHNSFFACLICPPLCFSTRSEFLEHARLVHQCSTLPEEETVGAILQTVEGEPACVSLRPLRRTEMDSNSPPHQSNLVAEDKTDVDSDGEKELRISEDAEMAENYNEDSYHSSEEQHTPSCHDGKSSSVECPKCDIVLGSSKSLGGHMTMVHSRNSSKTLKCPKCNWHYKYQETLDSHMKEKHPESEETCPYCLTGQSHPRLARGEIYSCGYKPYRCEICNYSTTSKGNLTIHMQSDKHVNNIQERQKNGTVTEVTEVPKSPTDDQPFIPRTSSQDIHRCDVCNYETNVPRNLKIHMTSEKHQQNCNLYLHARMQEMSYAMDPVTANMLHLMGMNPQQSVSSSLNGGNVFEKIPENSGVFQCLVCVKFMSDSFGELSEHVTRDRSGNDDNGDCLVVNGAKFTCKYCQYSTTYKANYPVHCATAKHVEKMQLVRHVSEGGVEDLEVRLRYLTNPVQVRCNACDYSTNSLPSLRNHLENNEQHAGNVAALLKLRDLQLANTNNTASSALNPLKISTRKLKVFCSLCTFTCKSHSAFMHHVRSLPHYAKWKQQRDQTLTASTGSADDAVATNLTDFIHLEVPHSGELPAGELDHHRNGNRGTSEEDAASEEVSSSDEESGIQSSGTRKTDLHRSGSEDLSPLGDHSRFICPLCQETCSERNTLESHLISKHNVQTEALERIMMLVETSGIFNKNTTSGSPKDSFSRDNSPISNNSECADRTRVSSESSDIFRCQKCSVNFYDIDQLLQHQNATDHLELKQTPRGPGYLCWKKGCNQYFKTTDSLQLHFREIHAKKKSSSCEKSVVDESDDGLAIDENGGPEMDEEMNSQVHAETGYKDANRKYKCHRCKVAFTKQMYLTAHNKTPQHRKGEKCNASMEKYLDPSRPHKCEVCKESFTQKNILIVHYNSVSHLHKARKIRQEKQRNLAELPRNGVIKSVSNSNLDDESKPFKCEVCRVQYANGSNLDIHRRSVAHQTRMARELQERNGNGIVDLSKSTTLVSPETFPQRMELEFMKRPTSEPPCRSPEKESPRMSSPASSSPPPSRSRLVNRGRGYGWGTMLESIGAEMVQQFLENQQKPKKADTTLEPVVDGDEISETECNSCHKTFTTPWILKVHRETAHADIVPVKILETVASEYRKYFGEKAKGKNVVSESVKLPVEQPVKRAPQPSPSPTPTVNSYADLLAAQMQLLPLLYPGLSMGGLNMMGMQAAAMMNLQPPLIAPNGTFSFEGLNSSNNSNNSVANQQSLSSKLMDLQNGQKRNRTRITDEQLQILRSHFDIRNPPSDDLLQRLCEQTGLELKVVKHWYRNTLFKERQRNKDSPYNFSVPPIVGGSLLDFDEPEVVPKEPVKVPEIVIKEEPKPSIPEPFFIPNTKIKREESVESDDSRRDRREMSMTFAFSPVPPSSSVGDARGDDRHGGKRANRTRFTDFQIKSLQDYFDKNPYPKDDDLEDLSRALNLPPRVITVWFQNARQKARKSYENSTPPEDESSLQRTAGLNYQCKKCFKVFQKFYEFTRHQKNLCTGTSAGSSRDLDDSCSIASASSFSSTKLSPVKTKAENELPVPQQQQLWDPNLSAMLGGSPFVFPGLYPPNSPFGVLQMEAISSQNQAGAPSSSTSSSPNKRRVSSDDEGDEETQGSKRVRTTILPEQLDYLYQQYKLDSNPSRKQLEIIAEKTGMKKRVVQVWYQNTRARDRKGHLQLSHLSISKRCPVCKMLFKVRNALESHISIKHADIYCKGDINIDDLPDTDAESGNERSNTSSPIPEPSSSRRNHSPAPSSNAPSVTESLKRMYADAMKKYMQAGHESGQIAMPIEMATSASKVSSSHRVESPLDLSAPHHQKPTSSMNSVCDDSGDERDNEGSEGSSFDRSMGSNMNMSGMKPGKRFRTQMSNAQLKVMKRLFADYKTPTMGECELIGREIGLAKRVVQVWFQNARAKEKKNRLCGVEPEKSATADHCPLCKVTYSSKITLQDHLFTKSHIALLKQSEDCHEGPSTSSSLISHMTSGSSNGVHSSSSKRNGEERIERKNAESTKKSSNNVAAIKTENLMAAQQNAAMMSPFGDLGAMMMTDPNMMAYMYASMNPYYGQAAAMSGLMNPYAGMGGFYDPTVHGTALGMLQLPPGAGELIAAKLATSDRSTVNQSVAFAQDGKRLSDLKECISSSDFACASSTQSDIGNICRKCQMVFPSEATCKNHQTAVCYPGTRDVKNVLKLMQIHFQCSACEKQYPTVSEFKAHCSTASHLKNRQSYSGTGSASLKRPSSNASSLDEISSGRRARPNN